MRTKRTARLFTDEPLHVNPDLIGQPLAPPWRRAAALALDYVVLLIPVLAVALGTAILSLRLTDPAAYRATRILLSNSSSAEVKLRAWRDLAPYLVRTKAPGLPAEAAAAVERGDLDRAADVLSTHDVTFAMDIGGEREREYPEGVVAIRVEGFIPKPFRGLALLGVAALYFTLFTASRRGATPGKRLMRIRVVHLGGEKLGLFESFERCAGYLEIPASLGLSLLSLWRDPNRRLPHDRIVNTAVFWEPRERRVKA